MICYPSGTEIRVGDAVHLHGRAYSGVIQHIIATAEEVAAWDLDEPGLIIDTCYGGAVFYPARAIADGEVLPESKQDA
jgi:hypothetical protein